MSSNYWFYNGPYLAPLALQVWYWVHRLWWLGCPDSCACMRHGWPSTHLFIKGTFLYLVSLTNLLFGGHYYALLYAQHKYARPMVGSNHCPAVTAAECCNHDVMIAHMLLLYQSRSLNVWCMRHMHQGLVSRILSSLLLTLREIELDCTVFGFGPYFLLNVEEVTP